MTRKLTWEVATLVRLDAPTATATRCPVGAESLVDLLGPGVPVLFAHSHVVRSDWESAPDDRHLRRSADDLRSYRQLPMGSLGIIVGSRLPLRMRTYGWRPDTWELAELNAAMAVCEPCHALGRDVPWIECWSSVGEPPRSTPEQRRGTGT
ncbi:MAG: hypothetical protein FJ276_36680 [Planctomycetes bacterium]|nr:hypothetical protein [Planctomycetota bacterium]